MTPRKIASLLVAVALVGAAAWRFAAPGQSRDGGGSLDQAVAKIRGTRSTMMPTDQAIRYFELRIVDDPQDFISETYLCELHQRRARETGDATHFAEAEAAARRALKLNPHYTEATGWLAASCAAQHKFDEALELARKAVASDGRAQGALIIVGDALMGLGRYTEAEQAYRELERSANSPAVAARLAHLHELRGNYDEALRLIEAAAKALLDQREPKEEVAWYQSLLGDLYFETGRLESAAEHFTAALRIFGDYHVALAGLGKVRAAEGQLDEAIELYKQAAESSPLVSTLATLGDLFVRRGDRTTAQLYFDRVESIAAKPGPSQDLHRRDLSLFLADHDLDPSRSLSLAEVDFATRKDIFAYDTLAWALYKNSRLDEASAAIGEALKLGGRQPSLCFHAGMIYYGRGENDKARTYLKRAIALNPRFAVLYADEARRTLAKLGERTDSSTGG